MIAYKVTIRTDKGLISKRGMCKDTQEFIEILKKIESENKDYIALHFFITREQRI